MQYKKPKTIFPHCLCWNIVLIIICVTSCNNSDQTNELISEKSTELYNNATAAYSLCCQYNDSIINRYDDFLTAQLVEKVFTSNLYNKSIDISSAPLKVKNSMYHEYEDILMDRLMSGDGSVNDKYSELSGSYIYFNEICRQLVDKNKISNFLREMESTETVLSQIDYSKAKNPEYAKIKTNDLLSVVKKIKEFILLFDEYTDKTPNYSNASKVTCIAQEIRSEIDASMQAFTEKYSQDK